MNQVDYQQVNGQQVQDSQGCGEEETKRKGLEFMALRMNVIDKRRELQVSKAITPAEYFLLEEIELGTVGGRNGKSTISSEAEFFLEDLANRMGVLKNKIYVLLKSMEKKSLIVRTPTRSKGREIIGLNPAVFGQILIDKQHDMEQRKHLRLAVDNSKKNVDNSPGLVPNKDLVSPESGSNQSRIRTSLVPNQDQIPLQPLENIEQNFALDSSRVILDCIRGEKPDQSEERFTPLTIGIEELQKKNNQSRVKPRNDSEDDPRDSEDAIKARDQAMKLFRKMGIL